MISPTRDEEEVTLFELLDRLIDRGVVLTGDITISVADVDLIVLALNVLLAPAERVEQLRSGGEPARPHGGAHG